MTTDNCQAEPKGEGCHYYGSSLYFALHFPPIASPFDCIHFSLDAASSLDLSSASTEVWRLLKRKLILGGLWSILCLLSVSCSTLAGPYSAYQVNQDRFNQRLKSGEITFESWMDESDNLLRKHYPADFRIEAFINERRKLLYRYRAGDLSAESLDTMLRDKFEPIREEREASYYAELPMGDDKTIRDNLQDAAILLNSVGDILRTIRR